jgi:hypothetical protein
VDSEGNPLTAYHGTSDEIDKFQLGHPNRKDVGWLGHGIYFTNNSDMAMANAEMKAKRVGGTPKVMSVHLNLQNPYYATLEDKARLQKANSSEASQDFTNALKDKGHDGVIWKQNDYHEYVAFDPDQIKILPEKATGGVIHKDEGGVLSADDPERKANLSKFMADADPVLTDEKGQPKRFYHATYASEPIKAFDRLWSAKVRRPSMDTVGTWFSDNPSEEGGAGMYGGGEGASIYPMHLSAKKLKTYHRFDDFLRDMHEAEGRKFEDQNPKGIGSTEGLREKLKAQGYDGLHFPKNDSVDLGKQIDQFDSSIQQMKSAFSAESKRRWDEGDEMSLSEQKAYQKKLDGLIKERMELQKKRGSIGSTEFGRQNVVVVFEPTQIKSPWNRGTYDTNEEDTHKATGGIVHKDKGGEVEGKTPISDWNWRPMSDVQEQLGGLEEIPSHVLNFGKFMDDTANKAGAKGLSARDLIKAFTITRASIQRGAVDADKVRAAGLDLDPSVSGKVRPEGAFGEWLHTDMGQRYLKNAERGSVDPVSISNAVQVMAPFGRHTTDIPDALTWAAKNIPGKEKGVSLLVVAAQQGTSDPSQWRDFIKDIRGIGPSKAGFVASLLGRGDQPTLDARQLILHTGQPSKAAAPYLKRKGGADEAVERLAERQRQMNLSIPSNLSPYYQHLAHHTVWDAVGGDQTTHQDVINAMQNAAQGGRIESNPVIDHPFVNVMQAMGLPVFGKKPKPIVKNTGGPVSLDAMRLALLNAPKMAEGGDFESDSLLPQGRAQRRMASNMMAGPKPLTIMKETGGQWLNGPFGNVEPTIGQYRQSGDATPEKQAVNNWVNTTLTKYMKRDFGTENDPVRLLHEQGITHYNNPDELESKGLRDHLSWITNIRKDRGMPETAISKSNLAKGWEAVSDPLIRSKTAKGLIKYHSNAVEMLSENPWMKKVDPQTKVFSFDTMLTDNTGFKHLTDELHNSLLENTNLPKSLQLRPESLNRMSVAQAVSHVHKINNWRKENMGDASREKAMTSAVHLHKDYPDSNYAWYEIKHPEMTADEKAELRDSRVESMEDASESLQAKYKTLEDALQYEGDVMGHCVGGYADEVASGKSRIFSLRNKKTGEPHVTVETYPKPISDLEQLPSSEKIPMQQAIREWRQRNPQVESLTDNHVREALKEAKIDLPEDIEQIKGKGNGKPVGKYIPFVQDFVKSGNWGDVGDLYHTDLINIDNTHLAAAIKKSGQIPSKYVTQSELTDLLRKYKLPKGYAAGGTAQGTTMPTLAQMKMALMKPNDISAIGAQEAPSMSPKSYVSPDKGELTLNGIPIGGVDMSGLQQGQQLMPPMPQPPQQPQVGPQGGQPPQGALPQGPPQAPPQGPQGPQSNMLQMTPQGQMMGAMKPQGAASGGSIQYPTIDPKDLANQDDGAGLQPVNWMSGGDVGGMAEGGSPEPSDNVSMLTEMLAKKYRPEVTTASEALGQHEGKNLKVTQSDRTKVGGGFLGGPGFSSLQHVDPDYEGMAWGVNSPGAASKIINATKEHPKGNVLWSTMIGSPEQHSSNQMVFNLMLREFKKGIKAGKLKPETRSAINQKLVSAVNTDGKPIFGNKTDISTPNFFDSLNTFDKRRVMADLMAGVAVGGKKGQIFNYDKILQDTTEPELVGAPTHAIGPRLFTVTGERSERSDLHPAFPHIIHGEDLGQMYHPVPNEVMLPEFHEKIQNTKGRKVGYMDLTRNTPSQFLSEEFLSGLQKKGYKKGGKVSMDAMQLALINRKKGK